MNKQIHLFFRVFSIILLMIFSANISHAQLNVEEANAFIKRILPEHFEAFDVEDLPSEEGKDKFEIESERGKIVLRGSNGVSIGSALNHYLKTFCNADISWNGTNLDIPPKLPSVKQKISKISPYKYRYYLNYCTFNYTMAWWDWERWEKEIDWMTLNGINMPLAVLGQNAVWQRVYNDMGFTNEELHNFFSGPAYSAFNWMGVLDDWAGPLPQSLIDAHESLQKKILQRQRALGMTPVLPAFTGHVPRDFKKKYPNAKLNALEWQGFPPTYVLDPNDSLFIDIGERFIKEQERTFGTDHLYSADTFIEMIPPSSDSTFLNDMSWRTYQSMAKADPQATWVMQGWMFHYMAKFWQPTQIKALLNAVPNNHMIILDLISENHPVWSRTDAYYGKPWVWCMLHNFGGNISLYGRMNNVANDPAMALRDEHSGDMLGIGLTPEAIEQNPVMYALMVENIWRDTPIPLDNWLDDYIKRRYGKENENAQKAWQILKNTVYNGNVASGGPESIITGRPTLEKEARWTRTELYYEPAKLVKAWTYQIEAVPELKNSDGFQYDLVDLTRQVLANYANVLQQKYAQAYRQKEIAKCDKYSKAFLELIDDLDQLLAARKDFLLGTWLEDAKRWGTTEEEQKLYERNARNIITLWGDKDSRLHDYACRQWAGLLKGFYKVRWEKFFAYVRHAQTNGGEVDLGQFTNDIKDWEWSWVRGNEAYSTAPIGDPITISIHMFDKYHTEMLNAYYTN
ncbi:alpha-N-acetylglucosaminidase [Parapedobacter tibetensis]|uniref:alpha-N-acetylglucosaminidase n=1 Tax=Parapedobacter tibetensis TaxID=2972951 RepID=UPI00214DDE87|nr:alpha-N-acetylglucosaminidase [Parapedobacter tibetensis]